MYGKLFISIYDGTLVDDWRALITFQQMIILCDSDGILDMTPAAIQNRTGIPIEHIKAGIEILENKDVYSRTTKEDGRRIVRITDERPWGWQIVNHDHYKNLRTAEDRRVYMREYMRERREKQKVNNTNKSLQKLHVNPLTHTDTDTDTYTDKDTNKDKDKKKTTKKQKNTVELKPDHPVVKIFIFWQKTMNHPKAALDDKRKSLIKKCLNHYSDNDLMLAITGCSLTPHNMGDNPRGERYDSIELIFRDSGHIDRFMTNAAKPPTGKVETIDQAVDRHSAQADRLVEQFGDER